MHNQDIDAPPEVTRGISLFPQRPPLQVHYQAARMSCSLHPGARIVLGLGLLLGAPRLLACAKGSHHIPMHSLGLRTCRPCACAACMPFYCTH